MMRDRFGKIVGAAIFAFATLGNPCPSPAADLGLMTSGPGAIGNCSEIVFTCENGRHYPLCPIAVSIAGEVVTASLHTGRHGGTHVRLVPMGVCRPRSLARRLPRECLVELREALSGRLYDSTILTTGFV
jgi:hypothetical protein